MCILYRTHSNYSNLKNKATFGIIATIVIKLPLGSTCICRKLKQNESFSISHNIVVLKTEVNADSEVTTEEELTTIVIDSEAITDSEATTEEELTIDSEVTT